jgi:hypothetical protein
MDHQQTSSSQMSQTKQPRSAHTTLLPDNTLLELLEIS